MSEDRLGRLWPELDGERTLEDVIAREIELAARTVFDPRLGLPPR